MVLFGQETRFCVGYRREQDFDARIGLIDIFIEMGFDDAIVVNPQSFAERILSDFKPAIDVSP
jgi:hypothetical protein